MSASNWYGQAQRYTNPASRPAVLRNASQPGVCLQSNTNHIFSHVSLTWSDFAASTGQVSEVLGVRQVGYLIVRLQSKRGYCREKNEGKIVLANISRASTLSLYSSGQKPHRKHDTKMVTFVESCERPMRHIKVIHCCASEQGLMQVAPQLFQAGHPFSVLGVHLQQVCFINTSLRQA